MFETLVQFLVRPGSLASSVGLDEQHCEIRVGQLGQTMQLMQQFDNVCTERDSTVTVYCCGWQRNMMHKAADQNWFS